MTARPAPLRPTAEVVAARRAWLRRLAGAYLAGPDVALRRAAAEVLRAIDDREGRR